MTAAADADDEIVEDLGSFVGVEDLGVELDAIGVLIIDFESRICDSLCGCEESEAGRELDNGIAVGHPNLAL